MLNRGLSLFVLGFVGVFLLVSVCFYIFIFFNHQQDGILFLNNPEQKGFQEKFVSGCLSNQFWFSS